MSREELIRQAKRKHLLEKAKAKHASLQGNPAKANEILDKGVTSNMPQEDYEVIAPLVKPQDLEFQTAKAYYDTKFGTNNTPDMVTAHIKYEYGEDATPQVANQMNKKALKWTRQPEQGAEDVRFPSNAFTAILPKGLRKKVMDIEESFVKRTTGAAAQLPTMAAEQAEYVNQNAKKLADKISMGNEGVSKTLEGYFATVTAPVTAPQQLARIAKTVNPEAEKGLQEWGANLVEQSGEIQSEHLSGKSFKQLADEEDYAQIGKDLGTMIAFEVPNLATQVSLGLASGGASLAFMGATSAGSKRADKTTEDPLGERVIAPIAVGAIEVLTEKLIGTQRIIDKVTAGKIKKGVLNRIKQIITDASTGALSEGGASFGENVVDRLSGEDVSLLRGVPEAMAVGAVMDAGTGLATAPMTVGDARRMRKQMSDEQIAQAETDGSFTPEQAKAVREAEGGFVEQNVEEANQSVFEPEVAEEVQTEQPQVAEEVAEPTGYMADVETMDDIPNITRSKSRVMNKVMTPIREVVGNVSPETKTRLDKWEFDTHQRKKEYTERSTTFLEGASELAKMDSGAFAQAQLDLKNANFDEASKILGKDSVDQIKEITEEVADELNKVGYDFPRKEDYFPRRVKDLKGLRNELGKDMGNLIDDAVAEQQRKAKKQGYTLSEMEIAKVINNVINGSYRPVGGRKPKSLKQRTIDEITPELDKYYYDAIESWIMYINEASDIIEMRKLLGKDLKIEGDVVDLNESLGEVVNKAREREGFSEEDANALIGALRARLGYRATGKLGQAYRSLTAMTTLGQFSNALTQLGDFTWSFYENGLFDTLGGAGDVIGKSGVTMQDLGIDEISSEFRTPNGMHDAVDKLFKYTGLKAIDRLGKETLVNSTLRQYEKMAETGEFTGDKQDKLDALFGADQDQVIADLKAGNRTKDVELLLFSTVLDWHPTTLSNMPQSYLEHPNGRILYTLKTFTIKQLDNFRRVAVDDMIEGVSTKDMELARRGFGRLMKLAGIMLAANIPIDLLKDWLTGKDIDMSDTVLDNLFKLSGASRYNSYRATRKGQKVSEALLRELIPPFPWFDYPAEDIKTIIDNLKDGDEIDLMNLESWNMLPFVGRSVYWRYGKGEEKEEKRREQDKS